MIPGQQKGQRSLENRDLRSESFVLRNAEGQACDEYADITQRAAIETLLRGPSTLEGEPHLEDQVEIDTHAPVVVPEELAILRVRSVGMNFKCVEVVRNVVN